jgi:hypothetical protein
MKAVRLNLAGRLLLKHRQTLATTSLRSAHPLVSPQPIQSELALQSASVPRRSADAIITDHFESKLNST